MTRRRSDGEQSVTVVGCSRVVLVCVESFLSVVGVEVMEEFGKNDLETYRVWRDENPHGYIWNPGHSCLHRATCAYTVPRHKKKANAKSVAKKVCAPTKPELVKLLKSKDRKINYCSQCEP